MIGAGTDRLRRYAPAPVTEWIATLGDSLGHSLSWRLPAALPAVSPQALMDYLTFTQGHARAEQVRILFLDHQRGWLSDEVIAEGDQDSAPFSIREILDRAFALNAGAMVLVHNHPSGDPKPSRADIELTRRLERTGRECGVALLDHIILAKGASISMRSMGLM